MKINFLTSLPAFAITIAGFLLPFCGVAQTSTVTRSLSSFDEIGISGGYEVVFLKEGDAERVSLEVSGTDPDNIVTEVKNGTLHIKTKKGNYRNLKAKITITYRTLKSVANSGSSDIVALTPIKADEFEFASSGSGDFKAEFDVKDLDVAISGSSDMTLKGSADEQEFSISGSGDVKLNVSGKVKSAVSGSGRVTNN